MSSEQNQSSRDFDHQLAQHMVDVIAANPNFDRLQQVRAVAQQIISHQGETYRIRQKAREMGSAGMVIGLAGSQATELDKMSKLAQSENRLYVSHEPDAETDRVYKDIVIEGTVSMTPLDVTFGAGAGEISAILHSIAELIPESEKDPQRQVTIKYVFIISTPRGSVTRHLNMKVENTTGSRKDVVLQLARAFSLTIVIAMREAAQLGNANDWQTEHLGGVIKQLKTLMDEKTDRTTAAARNSEIILPIFHFLSGGESPLAGLKDQVRSAIAGTFHQPKMIYHENELEILWNTHA